MSSRSVEVKLPLSGLFARVRKTITSTPSVARRAPVSGVSSGVCAARTPVKGLSIPAKGERRSMRNLTRTEDIGSVARDRSFVTDAPHKLEIERYDEASSWRTRL